jgi:hypothetical protein
MKNKKKLSLIILILLLLSFQTMPAFSESTHVVNKNTYGAFSKENMEKMSNIILAKDELAFKRLIAEGGVFPVKKGTRVSLEDTAFWSGCVKARPEGQTKSIWLFGEDLTKTESAADESQKANYTDKESNAPKIEGIIFDKTNPVVIIRGRSCFSGDTIGGTKILKILPSSVIIEQKGESKTLKIGDYL